MKVLIHLNSMGKGGAERVVSVLAKQMINDGMELVVVTRTKDADEYELPKSVERVVIDDSLTTDFKPLKVMARVMKLRRIIADKKPDIVISFCNNANFRASLSLMGVMVPLLVSVRNDPVRDYAPHRAMTRIMECKASGCVFQTKMAQSFFSERLQSKSRIIANPINEKYLINDNAERADRHETENIISTVGRISKQKNQLLLIKAIERLKEKYPDIKLHLYGEDFGDGTKQLMDEYIAAHELEKYVVYKGVSDSLDKELPKTKLFVLPSDYEGMPNSLMEAMALGMPVISTDCPCGGPAELIVNGESGILVPVGDEVSLTEAIDRVLSDTGLQERLAKGASKKLKMAAPQVIYSQWKDYITEIIG